MHAHVDPAVSEVVEDERLLRLELQSMQEVGLGLRPALGPLVGDAAGVEQGPVLAPRLAQPCDRPAVGGLRLGVALIVAAQIAQLDQGVDPLGRLRREFLVLK
jgi:hypothetical protein